MSNPLAIAAVTATLQSILLAGLKGSFSDIGVSIQPLDKARPSGTNSPQVNLFLYQVARNAAWANADMPGRTLPGELGIPPLPLNLYLPADGLRRPRRYRRARRARDARRRDEHSLRPSRAQCGRHQERHRLDPAGQRSRPSRSSACASPSIRSRWTNSPNCGPDSPRNTGSRSPMKSAWR